MSEGVRRMGIYEHRTSRIPIRFYGQGNLAEQRARAYTTACAMHRDAVTDTCDGLLPPGSVQRTVCRDCRRFGSLDISRLRTRYRVRSHYPAGRGEGKDIRHNRHPMHLRHITVNRKRCLRRENAIMQTITYAILIRVPHMGGLAA